MDKPPVYIWDLDGTLADYSHRARHLDTSPVDWPLFFETILDDVPFPFACDLFRTLQQARPGDCRIAICTARPERYRAQTKLWLRLHKLSPDVILMREDSDHREDVVVKHHMLTVLQQLYVPRLAFDDREPIVRMYRQRGVPCYHVAESGRF